MVSQRPPEDGEEDGVDLAVVDGAAGYFIDRLEPDAIEAQDALRGCQPEISFGGLLNIEDRAQAVPLGVMEVRPARL